MDRSTRCSNRVSLRSPKTAPTRILTTNGGDITASHRTAAKWRRPMPLACTNSSGWPRQGSEPLAMPDGGFSVRLYRRLLKLYPAGFRENYAGEMERQVLDEMAESRGPFALAGLWIRILVDLAVTVPSQLAREAATDARHAIRLWKRRPLHTGLAIAALAVGIGASTGVFSVVNALLLRALPFRDPDRLMATHIFY